MDKNEILAKSRNENKNGDEWQKDVFIKAYRFSSIAAAVLLGAFCLIKQDAGYLILMFLMNFFKSFYCAIRLKRKIDIVLVLVEAVCCILLIVMYISGRI